MESMVDFTQEERGGVLILRVAGRLDAKSSPVLETRIDTFIEAGKLKIVLNFKGVEYLSSAGMRLLLSVTKKLNAKNGSMAVSGVAAEVLDVIKMAGFDRILKIANAEEDAVKMIV
jgi:anti-anti-sigma factor